MAKDPEKKVIELLEEYGSLTLSEISEETGYSRSWSWKLIKRLEKKGVVKVTKHRGVLKISLNRIDPDRLGVLRIGILRAAEYPYIIDFRRRLISRWNNVEIRVIDDPYNLQYMLAKGSIHVAMMPAVTALISYRITRGLVRIIAGGSGGGASIIENPRSQNEDHVTTMASSMEYCAVRRGLPGLRYYASSGAEILDRVSSGHARYGVLWYPYVELAKRTGLRVEDCGLEMCCVLTANKWMEPYYRLLREEFARSIVWARRRRSSNLVASILSKIIDIDVELVKASIGEYIFYEEPPVEVIERNLEYIKETLLPRSIVKEAIYL